MVEIKAAALTDEILNSPGGMPLIICTNSPRVLRKVSQQGYQHLHLNTELSKALMSIPVQERPSQIEAGIKTLIPIHSAMLVSEFEMLFDEKDQPDGLRLVFVNNKIAVFVLVIPEELRQHENASAEAHFVGQVHCAASRAAFLLGEGSSKGERHFAVVPQRIKALCLEENTDRWFECGEHSDITDAVIDVSRKTGDALRYDQVQLMLLAVLDHFDKGFPVLEGSPRDALVSIDAVQMPVRVAVDQISIVVSLKFKGRRLARIICGDTDINANSFLTIILQNIYTFFGWDYFQQIRRYPLISVPDFFFLDFF